MESYLSGCSSCSLRYVKAGVSNSFTTLIICTTEFIDGPQGTLPMLLISSQAKSYAWLKKQRVRTADALWHHEVYSALKSLAHFSSYRPQCSCT